MTQKYKPSAILIEGCTNTTIRNVRAFGFEKIVELVDSDDTSVSRIHGVNCVYAVTAKNSNRIEISEVRLLDQFPQLGYFTEKEREEIIAVLVSTTPETVASELERRGYREKSGWSHVQSWAELAAQFIELFQ